MWVDRCVPFHVARCLKKVRLRSRANLSRNARKATLSFILAIRSVHRTIFRVSTRNARDPFAERTVGKCVPMYPP